MTLNKLWNGNVGTTLSFGFIWKLDQRWNKAIDTMLKVPHWSSVGIEPLI